MGNQVQYKERGDVDVILSAAINDIDGNEKFFKILEAAEEGGFLDAS